MEGSICPRYSIFLFLAMKVYSQENLDKYERKRIFYGFAFSKKQEMKKKCQKLWDIKILGVKSQKKKSRLCL